jgi:hypothetical protein
VGTHCGNNLSWRGDFDLGEVGLPKKCDICQKNVKRM